MQNASNVPSDMGENRDNLNSSLREIYKMVSKIYYSY